MYPLLSVGYQFIPCVTNNHVMYHHKESALTKRIMHITRAMPMNHPKFFEEVIVKTCRPVGYSPVRPDLGINLIAH